MGSYTKMTLDVVLKPETPEEILRWIQHFLYDGNHTLRRSTEAEQAEGEFYVQECACNEDDPPEAFYGCARWDRMLSWGHGREHRLFEKVVRSEVRLFDGIHLKTLTEIKNYDRELERFVAWILPHAQPQNEPFANTDSEYGLEVDYFTNGQIVTSSRSDYDDSVRIEPCPNYLERILNPELPKKILI